MNRFLMITTATSVFFIASLLVNCSKESDSINPVNPSNSAPEISSIISNPTVADWGDTCEVTVIAVDVDGDELHYSWACSEGGFLTSVTSNTVQWKAPESTGDCILSVAVSDQQHVTNGTGTIPVAAHPVLTVNMDSLIFETSLNQLSFMISNTGTGSLEWSATGEEESEYSWIDSISPESGSLSGGNGATINVGVSRDTLPGGTYHGWVQVNSNGGDESIPILLEVAELRLSVDTLDFGDSSTTMTFDITNGGRGILWWSISSSCSWITDIIPSNGSTTTEIDRITVNATRDTLGVGQHYDGLLEISGGGSAFIVVEIDVANPILFCTPSTIDFGDTWTSLPVSIRNNGSGTLNWSSRHHASWITNIAPSFGSIAAGNYQTVTVNVNRSWVTQPESNEIDFQCDNCNPIQTCHVNAIIQPTPTDCEWQQYDDGTFEDGIRRGTGGRIWGFVRFSRPTGWSGVTITDVQVYRETSQGSGTWNIDATNDYFLNDGLYYPDGGWVHLQQNTSQNEGWYTYNVTDYTLTGSHIFVGVSWNASGGMYLGLDTLRNGSNGHERSGYINESGTSGGIFYGDFGIRIRICEPARLSQPGDVTIDNLETEPADRTVTEGVWITGSLESQYDILPAFRHELNATVTKP